MSWSRRYWPPNPILEGRREGVATGSGNATALGQTTL